MSRKSEYETIEITYLSTANHTLQEADPEGKRWAVRNVHCEKHGSFIACGSMFQDNAVDGLKIILSGRWRDTKKYGRQFNFDSYVVVHPNGMEGTVAFLSQASGIGHVIAQRIWNVYGEDSIDVLIADPNRVCREIKGCNSLVAKSASAYLSEIYTSSKKMLPLMTMLSGIGIPKKALSAFVNETHTDHCKLLIDNPFYLDKFPGIGFLMCDELRKKLDLPADSEYRYASAVRHIANKDSSVWIHRNNFLSSVKELLTVNTEVGKELLNMCVKSKVLRHVDKHLALTNHALTEELLYTTLSKMRNFRAVWPDPYKIESMKGATEHQKEQLAQAFEGGRAAFLFGSPGVGKTYVASFLLKEYGGRAIACTPTNKAANRLSSCMKAIGVHTSVTTIHKALRATMENGSWTFAARTLGISGTPDLIVVDETSMLGDSLMLELIQCAPPSCQFLFIGDPDQLPPVDKGCLLSEWRNLASKDKSIKIGKLSEILRNSGEIVETCSAIRKGSQPCFVKVTHPLLKFSPNLQLVESNDDDTLFRKISRFVDRVNAGEIKIKGEPIDPMADVQFICAVNENSPVSRYDLNQMLQKKMNPDGGGGHKYYKEGDKVICLENTELMIDDGTDLCNIDGGKYGTSEKSPVSNGDMGIVLEADHKYLVLQMQSDNMNLYIADTEGGRGKFDLGYAITGHKSQGSEWPIVAVVAGSDYRAAMVMSREWIYTCLSRAREACVVFGNERVISQSIGKRVTDQRITLSTKWVKKADDENQERECVAMDGDS